MANRTPIVVAFTPNYFVPAATTLKSIIDSSFANFNLICLVSEDLSDKMKQELADMAGDQLHIKYINLKGRMKDTYIDERYTEAASYRLLLPEILPEYDKVVYIDCDVIVRTDIAELCNDTDLGENWLAAVFEAPIEQQAERYRALGCDPDHYFNSGFLIMNLKQMRQEDVVSKLIKAASVDHLEFPDQDALNQVCIGRVKGLSPVYNSIRTCFLPQYKKDFLKKYSPEEWNQVQVHGTIHYTGGKPWDIFSVKFSEWWKVYYRLPAAIRAEWTPKKRLTFVYALYKTVPGKWCLETARRIYRFVRYGVKS